MGRVARALVVGCSLLTTVAACGETRRPIGDECLRDDDCLSGACSARVCVGQAPRIVGTPPAADPFVPEEDAAPAAEAGADADAGASPGDAGDGG